jgi:2-oxoisovalerate dehydrogenase E1 component alpha subunit
MRRYLQTLKHFSKSQQRHHSFSSTSHTIQSTSACLHRCIHTTSTLDASLATKSSSTDSSTLLNNPSASTSTASTLTPSSSSTPNLTTFSNVETPLSNFLGARSPLVSELKIHNHHFAPEEAIPCFRLVNETGEWTNPHYPLAQSLKASVTNHPTLNEETLVRMYECMLTLHELDTVFYNAQRQGRISFYMTNYGEEAAQIGSSSALRHDDVIFAQYREAGVLMWRGFPLDLFAHQCFSNKNDLGKGRQMPVHYGSKELHVQTISSPLGTQIPQAAGAAYALKREGTGRVAMCYFGEGAASEGDFHPALNMASTLNCPVIFFVRNNGYAISTPSSEQYRGDGIAGRGIGYGIATIRVDGNDIFAVHEATAAARKYASENNRPVLIEAMTYRGGHHSTSDDSTRYRSTEEINWWDKNENPITRFRFVLEHNNLWNNNMEISHRKKARKSVLDSLRRAESTTKPPVHLMLEDVYDTLPPHLLEQKAQLEAHLKKYGQHYGLDGFCGENEYVEPSIDQFADTIVSKAKSS